MYMRVKTTVVVVQAMRGGTSGAQQADMKIVKMGNR